MCLGQSAATVRASGLGIGLLMTAMGAAGTWVGVNAGLKEKGWLAAAGWTTAVAGGLFGLVSLVGAVQLLFLSTAEIEQEIQRAKA